VFDDILRLCLTKSEGVWFLCICRENDELFARMRVIEVPDRFMAVDIFSSGDNRFYSSGLLNCVKLK
jgi:hypothetical protein